ncbi:MAG: porin family protein [Chitinophagaceae bacterium]|jgi:hypothetical protein
MKKILLLAATALIVERASAQLSIAPEIGVQMTNQAVNSDSSASGDMKTGFRAGVNLGLGLTKKINLHAGVFYSVKGSQEETFGIKAKSIFNYIEIPVYINYNVVSFGGNELFVGVGPYVAYCLNAKAKIKGSFLGQSFDEDMELPVGNDETTDAVKPLDFGANANIGFVTKIGLYARAHYSLGLANIVTGGDSDNSIKNNGFGLSVGYQIRF